MAAHLVEGDVVVVVEARHQPIQVLPEVVGARAWGGEAVLSATGRGYRAEQDTQHTPYRRYGGAWEEAQGVQGTR